MTNDKKLDAQQGYNSHGHGKSTAFVCPYSDCGVFAQHHWGVPSTLSVKLGPNSWTNRGISQNSQIVFAACEACGREVIYVKGIMIWPRTSTAPDANVDMPNDIKADFEEARQIHHASPRGAAALLRLALQKLLPHIGATKDSINDAIAELVANGTIPVRVQQALDAVRVIGNEAVHPGELDLRDDAPTVLMLFNLLNFIVEKGISEPKEINRIYGDLPPSKLKGIADRDAQAAEISASDGPAGERGR